MTTRRIRFFVLLLTASQILESAAASPWNPNKSSRPSHSAVYLEQAFASRSNWSGALPLYFQRYDSSDKSDIGMQVAMMRRDTKSASIAMSVLAKLQEMWPTGSIENVRRLQNEFFSILHSDIPQEENLMKPVAKLLWPILVEVVEADRIHKTSGVLMRSEKFIMAVQEKMRKRPTIQRQLNAIKKATIKIHKVVLITPLVQAILDGTFRRKLDIHELWSYPTRGDKAQLASGFDYLVLQTIEGYWGAFHHHFYGEFLSDQEMDERTLTTAALKHVWKKQGIFDEMAIRSGGIPMMIWNGEEGINHVIEMGLAFNSAKSELGLVKSSHALKHRDAREPDNATKDMQARVEEAEENLKRAIAAETDRQHDRDFKTFFKALAEEHRHGRLPALANELWVYPLILDHWTHWLEQHQDGGKLFDWFAAVFVDWEKIHEGPLLEYFKDIVMAYLGELQAEPNGRSASTQEFQAYRAAKTHHRVGNMDPNRQYPGLIYRQTLRSA